MVLLFNPAHHLGPAGLPSATNNTGDATAQGHNATLLFFLVNNKIIGIKMFENLYREIFSFLQFLG